MSFRRKSRQNALQILYQLEINQKPLPAVFEEFWENHPCHQETREFTEKLVFGTRRHLEEIDRKISRHLSDWNLERLSNVDRNIIRSAVYEIIFCPEIPPKVSINEALEIAKRFSDPKSTIFINGILNNIMKLNNDL